MPVAKVNGVDLYYEETGTGFPLVWSHEFGGDSRSWEPQVRYFSRRYRVIAYNHRGYPPSAVPKDGAAYSNDILVEDLYQLLRHLGIRQAHVGGLSMGANVALNFGLAHPDMARSLIIAACGSGSTTRQEWLPRQAALADALDRDGIDALVRNMSELPARRIFREKDPRGWAEFLRGVGEHSGPACAHLIRGVMTKRKTIMELGPRLRELTIPTLVMIGDQDTPCVEPALFMQKTMPRAGLVTLPMSGHTINIEEPALFNRHVAEFLAAVENGRWGLTPA
ncbi:MAG: alpha/beta fold hydrolase [Candidatus Rokubacteria bacterium]|nr:alpha/beta fold hydrolase [Candidatus Rokubacteria bacterium]